MAGARTFRGTQPISLASAPTTVSPLWQGWAGLGPALPDILDIIPGKSKCPGPYNWDEVTQTCVPKPDYDERVGITNGGAKDPTPHVTTPAERDILGEDFVTGIDARGNVYAEPNVYSRLHRKCPKGHVLDQNGLCYRKGTKGLVREWKKQARPVLSAYDAKLLRRMNAIHDVQSEKDRRGVFL